MKYFVLRDPSAKVPQRQVKLLTYTTSKPAKKKIKMTEREKKIVNKCVRRSLAWNAKVDSIFTDAYIHRLNFCHVECVKESWLYTLEKFSYMMLRGQ